MLDHYSSGDMGKESRSGLEAVQKVSPESGEDDNWGVSGK